ncbi:MAG TPA: T9SS type A sorting domain-containing protein, partial [Candidatus Kapabacteria bacterium]|nr:T9SS type A sorting domain-containing protein [Candidatus Kapabacteria bacterium]
NRNVPTQVGNATDWQTIATGDYHVLGLKTDGSLWVWGGNSYGELGIGTAEPVAAPRLLSNDEWVSISAGAYHSLAVNKDGTLWAWGYNHFGQLGTGDDEDRLVPTKIGNDTNWAKVFAGDYFSFAIKKDGSLWAWGLNDHGQLGLGNNEDTNTPQRINLYSDWVMVAPGMGFAIALRSGSVGVPNGYFASSLNFAPNPASDYLNITSQSELGHCTIQIFDCLGQLVYSEAANLGNAYSLDITRLPVSTYYLVITTENGLTYREMFVKR